MSAPTVFVNYRRADAAAQAGRVADALAGVLGRSHVFLDVDSIRPGSSFPGAVAQAVAGVDALVVIIGRDWLSGESARRLFAVDDYVRTEIEMALRLGKTVVPVVVAGASMPGPAELPPSIAALSERNAVFVDDNSFHRDLAPLLAFLTGDGSPSSPVARDAPDTIHGRLLRSRWSNGFGMKFWVVRLDFPHTSHQLEWHEKWARSPLLLDGDVVWNGHFRSLNNVALSVTDGPRAHRLTFAGSALLPVREQTAHGKRATYVMTIVVDDVPVFHFNWKYPGESVAGTAGP